MVSGSDCDPILQEWGIRPDLRCLRTFPVKSIRCTSKCNDAHIRAGPDQQLLVTVYLEGFDIGIQTANSVMELHIRYQRMAGCNVYPASMGLMECLVSAKVLSQNGSPDIQPYHISLRRRSLDGPES